MKKKILTKQERIEIYNKYNGHCVYCGRGDWKRKEFSDFEYIRTELSNSQCIGLVILLLLYNIGISIYIIVNQCELQPHK